MNEEIALMIKQAIEANQKPPVEFLHGVISGEIQISDEIADLLAKKGWLNRQKCEVWTRVMGYFRPVSQFNAGKKAEHADRAFLTVEQIKKEIDK